MGRTFSVVVLAIMFAHAASAQSSTQLSNKADSNYILKNFKAAAGLYSRAANAREFKGAVKYDYYSAADSYAQTDELGKAFDYLQLAVQNGYDFKDLIIADTLLKPLHASAKWKQLLGSIKARVTTHSDPYQVKIVTSDLDNFYRAFDLANQDTAHRAAIYKKYYIDAASPGMADYFAYKVKYMKKFIAGHDAKPKFYAAIRNNVKAIDGQRQEMLASFVKFKALYPAVKFPDVYFVIGNFAAAGTATPNGLLLGADQNMRTPDIPVTELDNWQNHNFFNLTSLPHVIAHELVHFQQDYMANDTTLLHAVVVEGMADFICELTSGDVPSHRYADYARGKEKAIWADFKKEMYLQRERNWIANGDQETADKPADLGCWVGYQICKAYYNNSTDKKQAIYNMLHISNYRAFYNESGVEKMLVI